jgi:hypothetical protein
VQQFVLFMEEECNGKIAYLFFGIFSRWDKVDGFEVAKVDIPAENVDVEKLLQASAVTPRPDLTEINAAITPCKRISSSGIH